MLRYVTITIIYVIVIDAMSMSHFYYFLGIIIGEMLGKNAQFKPEFKPIWSIMTFFSDTLDDMDTLTPDSGQLSNHPYYFESFIAFDHADDPIWPCQLTCIWLLKIYISLSVIWIKKKRLEWWVGWWEERLETAFVITMTIFFYREFA